MVTHDDLNGMTVMSSIHSQVSPIFLSRLILANCTHRRSAYTHNKKIRKILIDHFVIYPAIFDKSRTLYAFITVGK
jgi:hypothetical protein